MGGEIFPLIPPIGQLFCTLGGEISLFLSLLNFSGNNKNCFQFFSPVRAQSRVWGRHSPTSFPRGAKPQNCGFWHRGRNLLCNCRRLPLSVFSVHRTDRTGLPTRYGRSFFLSAKDTFQRPPATRWTGIFQNFFRFCNPGSRILATGGAENFSFHSLHHRHHRALKFAKRNGLFSLCFLLRTKIKNAKRRGRKVSPSLTTTI